MDSIWPMGYDPELGFLDWQLEKLCGASHGSREGFSSVASPWLFSRSEMYSQGKTLRSFLKWPKLLPIPVFSDHGVHKASDLSGSELSNPAKVHLTWSCWRAQSSDVAGRVVIQSVHPWVPYRSDRGIEQHEDATGTLFFVPHSVPGADQPLFNFEKYFTDVRDLPPIFQPRAICIAMHDVHLGLHEDLREFGLPIISAGNSASPMFVDRFYDIVRRFSYATSPIWGTQTFICEELGVKYFVFGGRQQMTDWSSTTDVSLGAQERKVLSARERSSYLQSVFGQLPGNRDMAKIEAIVKDALNLYLDHEVVKRRLQGIFWREIIRLMPYVLWQGLVYSRRRWFNS